MRTKSFSVFLLEICTCPRYSRSDKVGHECSANNLPRDRDLLQKKKIIQALLWRWFISLEGRDVGLGLGQGNDVQHTKEEQEEKGERKKGLADIRVQKGGNAPLHFSLVGGILRERMTGKGRAERICGTGGLRCIFDRCGKLVPIIAPNNAHARHLHGGWGSSAASHDDESEGSDNKQQTGTTSDGQGDDECGA